MNITTINHLETVLKLKPDEKLTDYKLTRLTAPGENYGSLILALDAVVTSTQQKGTQQTLSLIAKLIPPNDFIQQIFNTQCTFKNEIAFYEKIVPILKQFEKDNNVEGITDCVPDFYGGRNSLKSGDDVDEDAVLILENLKKNNFENFDRLIGFDLSQAKFILRDLAKLHGIFLSLKLKKSEEFKKVRSFIIEREKDKDIHQKFIENIIANIGKFAPELLKYEERLRKGFQLREAESLSDLFHTIIHADFWVNNIMLQQENGEITRTKIVDFQLHCYDSALKDLIFFIFTSVQTEFFLNNWDELIKTYYNSLISTLKSFNCDVTPFNFDVFQAEVEYEAKTQFYEVLAMLGPIFATKGTMKEIWEITMDDIRQRKQSDVYVEKLKVVIGVYVDKNWI